MADAKYICPQCYSEVRADDKFCLNCGANLDLVNRIKVDDAPKKTAEPLENVSKATGFSVTLLSMTTDEQEQREIREGSIVIGRSNADWVIDDPFLSPNHARLTVKDTGIQVDDLNSLNGVYRKVLEPTLLNDGDYVLIGTTYMRFNVIPQPGESDLRMFITAKEDYPVATLTMLLTGCRDGQVYPIHKLPFEIGRETGDLALSSDRFLSYKHCRFLRIGAGIGIEDAGSTNGTFIKIREKALLQDGEWLHMGRYLFKVEAL